MSSSTELQRIFRSLPGLFFAVKPDAGFTILAISDELLRASSNAGRDVIGLPLAEAFPESQATAGAGGLANVKASLQRVIATRQPDQMPAQRYDVRLPAHEGGGFEERYWSPLHTPVLNDVGEIDYIVQRAEDASAKANRNAVAILESITEGFFTLDRQWRFDYVNPEAHRILGVEDGALSGQTLWNFYPGLEGTEFERNYMRTMNGREKSSFTAYYEHQARWYEVTTFPAPEGIAVYFRDATARKTLEAERELLMAESERQRLIFETALNSTPDFVYVFDTEHRALYANAALLRTWGVDDVRGKTWVELGYEQWHADLHDEEIDRVIRARAPIRGEVPFTGTNGRRVYDYIFAPVLDAEGQVVAVAGTTRDVTERQADERAVREQAKLLVEADLAKTEFLATLSHELRNPLSPLRNAIELFRRKGPTDEASLRLHAIMDRQVNHLIRLVDDLLEISRISRGALSLRNERVSLETALNNAVETSEPLIKASGHTLVIEPPDEVFFVNGDLVRLTQILSNLLNNAASYTEPGGHISVQLRRSGAGTVAISVRDDGIGIDPLALPRLFEMFSRGHRDRSRNQGGLGIGLALARRLAEMHGGTLQAHSEGPGKGSEFVLQLPLVSESSEDASPRMLADARLSQLRLLLIDDNVDAAQSLGLVLSELGAQVRIAHNGPEGLKEFAAFHPAVVLLDIGMPGMNGYEVARGIRSKFPERSATLIALTGWGQEDDREQARHAGFDHHLVKPADIVALQNLLAPHAVQAAQAAQTAQRP